MQDTQSKERTSTAEEQVDADAALARALAESERDMRRAFISGSPSQSRCSLS